MSEKNLQDISPRLASPIPAGVTREWLVGGKCWELGQSPLLMGIVNATPDSFSDGGCFYSVESAVQHGLNLVQQGAGILDVGGESTRPGAENVSEAEELRRVIPVIEKLAAQCNTPLSIDTTKAAVAREALRAGAVIVNDISGLTFDEKMPEVCAEGLAAVICMHIQGTPQTMQIQPCYEDVVPEVAAWLERRLRDLESCGIPRERVALDPGIGFGKTAQHNLQILASVGKFRNLGRPVCIGHSRKRFLKTIIGRPVDERSFATVGISIALAMQSTDIIRLHDVAATRDALCAWRAVTDPGRVLNT